jgi:sulfofructose kinase
MHVVCVGVATLDAVFEVPYLPEEDGRVIASEFAIAGGGPAANSAVTLARLGVETFMVGAVGDDEIGKIVREGLQREGVDTSELAVVPGARTPQSTILTNRRSASRTLIHFPGAPLQAELSARARELCVAAEWVHVDNIGYPVIRGLRHAVRLSIDGALPIDNLELDGVALYSPTEAVLHQRFAGPEGVIDAGAELVVVTRADAGSLAMTRDGTVVESPALRIDPVSTTGAGDVFRGALLAQLMRNVTLRKALTAANVCAALACRSLDGRSAIPSADEIDAMVP